MTKPKPISNQTKAAAVSYWRTNPQPATKRSQKILDYLRTKTPGTPGNRPPVPECDEM